MQDARGDFVGAELFQRAENGLERALHVGLHDQRELLAARRLELRHHLLERAAHAGDRGRRVLALLVRTVARDLAGAGFVLDHCETITGFRRDREAAAPRPARTGPASCTVSPGRRSARERGPISAPATMMSPTRKVPRWTSTVATGPRPRSSLASITVPSAGRSGVGLEVENFGLQQRSSRAGCRDWSCSWPTPRRRRHRRRAIRPASRAAAVRCARARDRRPACRSC